ncbi:MAG: hypothetical protein NTY75_04830, partial [Candidatus Shapirobacteria bacterium]|nr:hypothetical protein [Candidatus Shapirobacteria bacterium]
MRHSRKEISIIWLILSLLMATLLVNQCLSLVYFWLNQTIGSGYLLILGVIILAVITVFLRSGVKVVLIKKEDILALGIALVMGLSFVPTLWNYNHSFRLPIITSGVDIMAHFNMFIKMTETGKLNYGSGVFDNFKPWAGWSEYPSGFYATAGTIYLTLVKPFLHSTSDPVILTSFFSLFSIGLFCWLGYWLTVLVTSVVGSKNKMGLAHWLLIFALVFYFMEGTF